MTPDIEITSDSFNPADTTEVNIQGATIESTLVTGGTGTPGAPGLNGQDGEDGRDVELQNNGTHIQWRYVGDNVWNDLVLVESLRGANGIDGTDGLDGAQTELRMSGELIQYRFGSEEPWTTLIDLSTYTTAAELSTALSSYATTSALTSGLATKQNTGDYATNASLTSGLAGKANTSHTHATSDVTGLDAALAAKASTAYVDSAVAGIVDTAPTALNTLNELAAALGDDPNFATTISTQIGTKADATHTHVKTDITDFAHNHDDRYYTETEIDTMIGGLTPAAHTHTSADVTDLGTTITTAIGNAVLDDLDNVDAPLPNAGDVLTYNDVSNTWDAAAPSGGGQSSYDIVVAADGTGDYTTLSDAIGAATNSQSIFIKEGTYTLSANLVATALGLRLYGAGQGKVNINLATYYLQLNGSYVTVKDITFTMTSGYLYVDNETSSTSSNALIEDCTFNCTPTGAYQRACWVAPEYSVANRVKVYLLNTQANWLGFYFVATGSIVKNSLFHGATTGSSDAQLLACGMTDSCIFVAPVFASSGCMLDPTSSYHSKVTNCFFWASNGHSGRAINNRYSECQITDCTFMSFKYAVNNLKGMSVFTGNKVKTYPTSDNIGVIVEGDMCTVSNNSFGDPNNTTGGGSIGIQVAGSRNTVMGNTFRGLAKGIDVTSGSTDSILIGNNGQWNTDGIADAGTGTILVGNGIA